MCVCVCVCVRVKRLCDASNVLAECMLVTSGFQPSPLASAAACSTAKREPSASASPVCTKPLLSVQNLSCLYKASPVCTKPLLSVQSLSCLYKASPVSTKPLLLVQSLSCQYKASPVSTKPLLSVQSLSTASPMQRLLVATHVNRAPQGSRLDCKDSVLSPQTCGMQAHQCVDRP